MIAKNQMMELLLDAAPSFKPQWGMFLDEWKDEPGQPPIYVALGDFARHLIGMLERGEDTELFAVFNTIERFHSEGDEQVQEMAVVGILESIQNTNLHSSTEPELFRKYFGSESKRSWDKLYNFWEQ